MGMTMQDVLTTIYTHFSQPGAVLGRVYGEGQTSTCVYRGPNGAQCAVGCLLTDDEVKTLDWAKNNNIISEVDIDDLPERLQDDDVLEMLCDLQVMHDRSSSVDNFLGKLRMYAAENDLRLPGGA